MSEVSLMLFKNSKKKIRYVKPSMTNLPYRLGKRIIKIMDNTPPVDFSAQRKEADEINKRLLAIERING